METRPVVSTSVSASSSSPVICGISFDAENTLLSYTVPSDSFQYVVAYYDFAALQYKNNNIVEENVASASAPLEPCPWRAEENVKDDARESAFNDAWVRAEEEQRKRLGVDVKPWCGGGLGVRDLCCSQIEEVVTRVHDFYALVVQYFFHWKHTNDAFTRYLLLDHYVSRRVYNGPDFPHAFDSFKQLRDAYPQLPMVVVSNTDYRIVQALHLFPEYKDAFPVGRILHANNLRALKPSKQTIFEAMDCCGVLPHDDDDNAYGRRRHRWLHVGDDLVCDGGAASNAGCLYLACDPVRGVNFLEVLEIVASDTPELVIERLKR